MGRPKRKQKQKWWSRRGEINWCGGWARLTGHLHQDAASASRTVTLCSFQTVRLSKAETWDKHDHLITAQAHTHDFMLSFWLEFISVFSYYIIFHACICAYEAKWNKIIGVFAISAAVISSCPCHDWCYISVLFVQVIPKHWVYLAPILCYLFKNDLCVTFCSKANKHIMITSLFNLITRLDLNTSVWTTQPGLSISLIIRQDFITVEGMWAKFGPLEKLFRSEFELHYICLSSQIYGSLEM